MRAGPRLALDRAPSSRTYDADGRLRVSGVNITMEAINAYRGDEIVDWQELGLDHNATYQVYRPGVELAKAAGSFNSVPLLRQHVPVTAQDHRPSLVVGATGGGAIYQAPYLRNSLIVWANDSIMAIDSGRQRELSAAYRYKPVLERGTFNGKPYSIRMTNIEANHVALVETGRAGPTCMVADAVGGWIEEHGARRRRRIERFGF